MYIVVFKETSRSAWKARETVYKEKKRAEAAARAMKGVANYFAATAVFFELDVNVEKSPTRETARPSSTLDEAVTFKQERTDGNDIR